MTPEENLEQVAEGLADLLCEQGFKPEHAAMLCSISCGMLIARADLSDDDRMAFVEVLAEAPVVIGSAAIVEGGNG